jgi:hypothetical protein
MDLQLGQLPWLHTFSSSRLLISTYVFIGMLVSKYDVASNIDSSDGENECIMAC